MQDAAQTKEHIVNFLRRNGPSLPVHIAKNANMSMLFTSAFLSELIADKLIKMTDMRVGSSPVYFLPTQEPSLEKFAEHLKSKDKEAFLILKERKFIRDLEFEPAIRVALRTLKDFAMPFEREGDLYWRYFTAHESEFTLTPKVEQKIEMLEEPKIEGQELATHSEILKETEELNEIKEEIVPKKKVKSEKHKKPSAKKQVKKDDKFFDKVKEHLERKGTEIIGVEGVGKSELILKIKEGREEKLIFAFKKKKITDSDLMKAFKKSSDLEMPYKVLSMGETPKKLSGLIEAAKSLENMEKIE